MKKIIQRDGTSSNKIRITSSEMKIYKFKTGEIVDVEISKIKK